MPSERDLDSVTDIVLAAQQILRYSQFLDRDGLENNDEKQAAILYRIMVIGEATKRISQAFRIQYSEIPWKYMAGMRDVIVHEYDQIDLETLWNVVSQEIPALLNLLDALILSLEDSES